MHSTVATTVEPECPMHITETFVPHIHTRVFILFFQTVFLFISSTNCKVVCFSFKHTLLLLIGLKSLNCLFEI